MGNQDLGDKQESPTLLENRNGWMVPVTDKTGFDYIYNEVADLSEVMPYCRQFHTCVQAGGNIGIWPLALAKKFTNVYTVEPDSVNYSALKLNCRSYHNMQHRQAAFGANAGSGSIRVGIEGNMGALQVKEGTDFDIITIDSLELEQCDLIQLDVEGYEYFAIQGATETISKFHPVICIEVNGLSEKYGQTDGNLVGLVESFGYKLVKQVHRDFIFIKG